jgi:hypothetical protein
VDSIAATGASALSQTGVFFNRIAILTLLVPRRKETISTTGQTTGVTALVRVDLVPIVASFKA